MRTIYKKRKDECCDDCADIVPLAKFDGRFLCVYCANIENSNDGITKMMLVQGLHVLESELLKKLFSKSDPERNEGAE